MKTSLGIAANYFDNSQPSSLQTVPALQKLLDKIGAEPRLIAKLNTVCDISEFQLGDEITQYQTSDNTNNVDKEQSEGNFYLVCEGRVRLLAVEASQQQEISAAVLEVGAIFGTDNLFIESGLPYRAIAAGTCQIARIPATKLQLVLEEFPQLQQHLQQKFQQIDRKSG